MSDIKVISAVWGCLDGGGENSSKAFEVSAPLQRSIDSSQGIVTINNDNLGGDPAKGVGKHFGAVVSVDGKERYFACAEGHTIDFYHFLVSEKIT